MHEDRRLWRHTGAVEDVLLVGERVVGNHPHCRKVPEHEFVALLGDVGRRSDIDDERHAFLFGDLGNRGGLAGIECADQELRAFANKLFSVLHARYRRSTRYRRS